VSIYAYINPLIAVILGALLLDEPFSARTVVAMAIVFAGVALVKQPAPKAQGVPAGQFVESA
jgi:drug/metabolite transporter (DMT)-like permease